MPFEADRLTGGFPGCSRCSWQTSHLRSFNCFNSPIGHARRVLEFTLKYICTSLLNDCMAGTACQIRSDLVDVLSGICLECDNAVSRHRELALSLPVPAARFAQRTCKITAPPARAALLRRGELVEIWPTIFTPSFSRPRRWQIASCHLT